MSNSRKRSSNKAGRGTAKQVSRRRGGADLGPDFSESESSANSSMKPQYRNDISWHVKDPKWLEAAARIGFGLPLGARQEWGPTGGNIANNASIPGIMTFIFTPTYGIANNENAELNRAMVNMFNKIRSHISGKRDYERTDLMKYMIAIDSLYMFYAFVVRIYKCLNVTSHRNYYIQKALIESMGMNFENLTRHSTDLFSLIRQLRMAAGQFCIPTVMDIYKRHKWMLDHIWRDDDSDFAQLYMFLPRTFYRWRDVYEDAERPGIAPIAIPWIDDPTHGLGTLDDLWNMFHNIYDPIQRNGDIGQMSADVASVYGADVWIPDDVGIGEAYIPEYSEEALMQIQNCTMIGDFELDPDRNVIYEPLDVPAKHGYLASDFRFVHPYKGLGYAAIGYPATAGFTVNRLLNFTSKITDPANTMEATRLTNIPDRVNDDGYWEWTTYTTEIVNYARIHYFSASNYADFSEPASDVLPINPYDLVHYETDRIFSSMLLYNVVVANTTSITQNTQWYVANADVLWSNENHCSYVVVSPYSVEASDFNSVYTNKGPMRNARIWNSIRTMMSVFNWHPPIAYTSVTSHHVNGGHVGFTSAPFIGFDQDLDVCGMVHVEELRQMNKLDVSSEFDVLR